jgi:hypothetical protein
MTMKTRTRVFALLLAGAAGITACDHDLTEVPFDFVAPENFYRNANDALAALNAAYAAFSNFPSTGYTDNDYYGRHFWFLVEYPTETMTLRLDVNNERTQPDIFRTLPDHNYVIGLWRAAYHAVNRANAVIDNVPNIDMDVQLRDRIVAEAKFLRALHYFNLVRLFDGVPLHLKETKSLADATQPRATRDSTYRAIIADLTAAAGVLPASYGTGNIGRATRGAARTLLGKVYLQWGALGGGPTAFQQAESTLRQVVTEGTYRLLPNYADVFSGPENNAEVIFDIQNSRVPGLGGYLCDQLVPRGANFPYCDSQNPSFQAEWPFFYSYEANDTRKATTWLLTWTSRTGTVVDWDSTQAAVNAYGLNGPAPRKFLDTQIGSQDGAEDPNFILLRYSDVLLMLAEAINENAGPTAEAKGLVDQVRARAGLQPMASGLSKAQFKDALFLERRFEFVMELHGHFDSQRHWTWAEQRIEQNASAASRTAWNRPGTRNSSVPKASFDLTEKHLFYPIPQTALQQNKALSQNPGY